MTSRPPLILCVHITADGKLDPSTRPEDFPWQPGDVSFELTSREDPTERSRELWARAGTQRVICCGGPQVFRRLLNDRLVAEIILLVRPKIDGRRGAATLSGGPGDFFPKAVRCRLLKMEVRGHECLLRYRVLRTKAKRAVAA